MSPFGKIKSQIIEIVSVIFPEAGFSVHDLVPTPSPALGDLALPMFKAAKAGGLAPSDAAEVCREKIGSSEFISEAAVVGPYLNFRLNRTAVTKLVLAEVAREKKYYGNAPKKKERVMVEYISPNVNKPLHLGHLRNAATGEAIARILEASGSRVIRATLLNDRGAGITKAMLAYSRWGGSETPAATGEKSDHFVGRFYVLFDKKKAEHPELDAEVARMIRAWEDGDKKILALWRAMIKWCTDGQNKTIKRLGIKFDKVYRESAIYNEGKKMVLSALENGLFAKDEKGNIVAKLPGEPDKVVLRADGTAVYITTDIVLTVKKMVASKLDRSLWIVGSEQDQHLRQLFGIMRLLGYPWAEALKHVSCGEVALPEGRMKSRSGTVVDVDELVDHLAELAAAEVASRHDFLVKEEVEKRAEEIALAAVKYYLLSVGAGSRMTFNPKESLSFTGKTGPYLQYMSARIASVLRKAADGAKPGRTDLSGILADSEWKLTLLIAAFPDTVAAAAESYDPSLIAKYDYDLAKAFSEFYENMPILKAAPEVRRARLTLVRSIGIVLGRGMSLLAIPAPKEM